MHPGATCCSTCPICGLESSTRWSAGVTRRCCETRSRHPADRARRPRRERRHMAKLRMVVAAVRPRRAAPSRDRRRVLLLLAKVDALALEHVQEGLRALHNLGVGGLRLGDGLVVLGARGDLAREIVVDAREPLGQDPEVILDLGCGQGSRKACELRRCLTRLAWVRASACRAAMTHPSPPHLLQSICSAPPASHAAAPWMMCTPPQQQAHVV